MKVVYTEPALRDLDDILTFIATDFPVARRQAFEQRLHAIERRIGQWPESAQLVAQHPGVRVVPLVRFPYKASSIRSPERQSKFLHLHHTARREL